jgi:hypothetical protein
VSSHTPGGSPQIHVEDPRKKQYVIASVVVMALFALLGTVVVSVSRSGDSGEATTTSVATGVATSASSSSAGYAPPKGPEDFYIHWANGQLQRADALWEVGLPKSSLPPIVLTWEEPEATFWADDNELSREFIVPKEAAEAYVAGWWATDQPDTGWSFIPAGKMPVWEGPGEDKHYPRGARSYRARSWKGRVQIRIWIRKFQ